MAESEKQKKARLRSQAAERSRTRRKDKAKSEAEDPFCRNISKDEPKGPNPNFTPSLKNTRKNDKDKNK